MSEANKPTGSGTGLSLSYDIVTQGHGGMLESLPQTRSGVESKEGEGAAFVVRLPVTATAAT
ncbi:MAG TPA: hypothetical protein VKP65_24895 [Rhodothermales bacterium]|nr:hypothetical protein [Rhodothermales bacterium]